MTTVINEVVTNNVVQNDSAKASFDAKKPLENLEARRVSWESGAYRTSNQQLYAILSECLAYVTADLTVAQAKERNAALEAFFKSRGYAYKAENPLATRIIKAVFGGIDRRQVSTYSLVLRQAVKEGVMPLNLPLWIETRGGVQEVRLGQSKTYVSPKNKTASGKNYFGSKAVIGNAKSESLSMLADAGFLGHTCVLLAEQQADGSFDIKALLRSDAAVNAAYMALYQQEKEVVGKAQAEKNAANDADGAIAKKA